MKRDLRRPEHWPSEARITYLLKLVALFALAAFIFINILNFLGRIKTVSIILVGAVFFSYVIYPAVRKLNAKLPLTAAIGIVYLTIVGFIGFLLAVIVPALSNDIQDLVKAYPQIAQSVKSSLTDPHNAVIARLPVSLRDYIGNLPAEFGALAHKYGAELASGVLALLLSTVTVMATAIAIPVLAAYLLFDAENIKRVIVGIIPTKSRPKTLEILGEVDKVLGGFIRGQVMVGATIGVCITIMLLLTHVKYAVLIGFMAGVLDIIPYVGAVAAFIPAVSIAAFNDGLAHAGLVALFFVLIFQLEGHFIAPRIVSESVGLTPLMVIIAILVGGELLGIAGMFIAVPIAGILRVLALTVLPPKATVAEAQPSLTEQPREQVEELAT